MARFNFRIGTKLGLIAGIGVVLVSAVLANRLLGNHSIAEYSRLVISNYSNKSNAQTTETVMVRAQLGIRDLSGPHSAAELDDGIRGFRTSVTDAGTQAASAAQRKAEMIKLADAFQAAVGAIKEIGATISHIAEIASTIAATVEEQGAATAEIARNVGEAAKGTAEVAEKITQVNRGAGATGSASAQVLASARSLSKESGNLKTEVENFLNTVRAA